MQQNYHQSLLLRPRRRFSKRPAPQARIRPRKAACGDHPAGLASDYPSQARIRPRKAACGDPPPVEQATRPPKRESAPAG